MVANTAEKRKLGKAVFSDCEAGVESCIWEITNFSLVLCTDT